MPTKKKATAVETTETPATAAPAAATPKAAKSKAAKRPTTAKVATAKVATAKVTAKTKVTTAKGAAAPARKAKALTAEAPEAEEVAARPTRARRTNDALVIVESPAKAKTIKKYLGPGYVVKASVGHVKDLPKKKMGIDIEHGFQPEYVVIDGKKKVLAEIMEAARHAQRVLLAPDPDREGEAIAWHIAEEVRSANPNIQRVLFNEITKKAINEAIGRPMELDIKKFESQQARRVLDRLVGYQISPVLWTKVRRGLSAGRVQSVAVRLVAEREQEITAFRPEEYWTVEAEVEGKTPPPFTTKVAKLDGKKAELTNEGGAREVVDIIKSASLVVSGVERKERRKNPPPPFITSKLQQEASSKLRFSPKRTMGLSQRLYEGVEVGEDGLVGLITYMRTDSTRISDDATTEARGFISERYGAGFLPAEPVVYKSKKGAQDAHEAIRPTSLKYDPETVRKAWAEGKGGGRDERESDNLLRLYTLIWNRFVACQMVAAVFDQTSIDINAGRVELRASGQVMKFAGFLEVYAETVEDAANEDETGAALPDVHEGEAIRLLETRPEQHFTQPPPRFSEATLVKELEEKGIGRPSTYAAILSTVQDRGYVEKKEGRLHPTELGVMVNGLLVKSFPGIVSSDFTAQMEEQLDQVEDGTADWVKVLDGFYGPFKLDLEKAKVEMRDIKREEKATDQVCEKCGKPMVIKWGRNGHFLACSGYPDCRNTKEFTQNADGSLTIVSTTRPSDQNLPDLQLADGDSARALRRVPGLLALSGVQDHQPAVARRRLSERRVRRLPHREALQARQGLLRLLELLEDPVRLRLLGPPPQPALPEVRRQVRRPEGLQGGRHPHPLPQGRLRLHGRRREPRGERGPRPRADRHRLARATCLSGAGWRCVVPRRRERASARSAGRGRRLPHERGDRLDVAGLREHVERLQAQAAVAGRPQRRDVGGLRLRVAGDVDDRARGEGGELAEKVRTASLARRIDDDGGLGGGEGDGGEDRAGVGGQELAIGAAVAGGVGGGPAHGAGAHFDAQHTFEPGRGREREQAAAAIGVDEKPGAPGCRLAGDVRGEARQQERVVLEEVARQELQRQLPDLLGDHLARIDGDARGGLAHQQRGAVPVALPAGEHLGAQLGEARVHRGRGDRAGGDVDGPARQPDFEEPDRHRPVRARAREVRRQLRPVAVRARRRNAGGDGDLGEESADLLCLARELVVVGEVLILAAAAATEQRAGGGGGRRGHGRRDYSI